MKLAAFLDERHQKRTINLSHVAEINEEAEGKTRIFMTSPTNTVHGAVFLTTAEEIATMAAEAGDGWIVESEAVTALEQGTVEELDGADAEAEAA